MNAADIIALLPLIVISVAAIVIMLVIGFYRHHGLTVFVTIAGLAATLVCISIAGTQQLPRQVTPLLQVDYYSLFFIAVFCLAAIAVTLLSYGYFKNNERNWVSVPGADIENRQSSQPGNNAGAANAIAGDRGVYREEFYILLLVSTLGAFILVSSAHFATFFLGLEVLSIPLLAMIAYPIHNNHAIEAGVKFLVLTALASAFLLFGMALIYAQTGTMEFQGLARQLAAGHLQTGLYFVAGVMLLMTGVGFKLSLVPFHMWTPDVYQGAPPPVSAYVATVSKGAMFVVLMRYFFQTDALQYATVLTSVSAVAIATMLVGNLLALLQSNIKRVLAYSSIAHLGYLLLVLLATKTLALEAAGYFVVAYMVTNLGAFGIVTLLESGFTTFKTGDITEYRGLFWHHPWLAGAFTIMLLSLAGIPLTVGFVGKFYVIAAGVEHTLWLPVFAVVVGSAIGLFYYLRIVVAMYAAPQVTAQKAALDYSAGITGGLTLTVLTLILLWAGIFPGALIAIIRNTVVAMI
ncbi:MAG: NADH-quinone oxidoreductase subunit N [Gammaproteobacteria bacterium]